MNKVKYSRWISSDGMTQDSANNTRGERCSVFRPHGYRRNDNHPAFSDAINAGL